MGNKFEPSLFPIGKTAEICGVSARTLRFYEKNGLIRPDRVDKENHYRYYSYNTMRQIQTIRYLLEEGFALSTIREMLRKDDLSILKDHFLFQIAETEEQILFQEQRLASLKAWRSILVEGGHVLEHRDTSVRTRYIEEQPYYFFRHRPQSDEERTEAFLETSYLIRSRKEGRSMMEAVGTFHVLYDSFEKRLDGSIEDITLLQTVFPEAPERDDTLRYGGFTAVTCYHIGPMGNIRETYERMLNWAAEHQLSLQGSCMERQVLDTYSVVSPEKYVTEILLPIAGDPCGKER